MSAPTRQKDRTLLELIDVRGGDQGFPIGLVVDDSTERLVIRGINEGGFACVDIDLLDLVGWLSSICPDGISYEKIENTLSTFKHTE